MEDRGEGAEGVGAGHLDLAHHVDRDGARLTQRGLDTGVLVVGADLTTDALLGGRDRETTDMDGTKLRDGDIAIGTDHEGDGLLRGTIDIEHELVARTQDVVLGGGNVHDGLEGEVLVVEDVTAKDALAG